MTTLENPPLRTEGAPVQGAALGATAALIVGTFAVVMSATTINIAIVPMMQEFAVSHRVAQLFSSLFLGATVLTAPLAAWLSRRWDARQVFLGVLLIYALASLAATLSDSFLSMLLARGLQGACAGVIQPLSMFLVLAAAAPERQGRAMSLYGLGVVLAPALGPTIAGWFVDHIGWRSTFSLGVPPALLALGLGWFCLPRSREALEEGGSFDWPGLALLGVLVTLTFVTPLALERSAVLAGALCLLWLGAAWLFWRVERARKDALLPFALFASPGFRAAALVSVAYGAGMYGSTFLIPVFMQGALGIPALTTGNILLLGGVALALSTSLAGRVVDRLSARLVVAGGLACFALACALLAWARELLWIAVAVVLCRIGLGLVIPGLYTGMAQVVVPGGLREGTAVITLLRQGGGALGVSLIGVLTASAGSAELAGWLGLAASDSAAAAPATVFAGIALLFVAALLVVRRLR
ncbi:MFS transporter [Pseudomonas sp. MAP12]|uniref:MFS transporter n=1 Tax=Geopseudomonas aromaticivorans TaxID=2849492 RepID=A0ABS6MTN2_9GAMM|nr:MFS transporter [Pseudomonas aromaticivorans]MBV2132174.1 MFS transporter [Pseudomonas aromaticivorans]